MRCIACGENMILFSSVPDIAMMVPGYERQTLQCSGCGGTDIKAHLQSCAIVPGERNLGAHELAVSASGKQCLTALPAERK